MTCEWLFSFSNHGLSAPRWHVIHRSTRLILPPKLLSSKSGRMICLISIDRDLIASIFFAMQEYRLSRKLDCLSNVLQCVQMPEQTVHVQVASFEVSPGHLRVVLFCFEFIQFLFSFSAAFPCAMPL